MVDRKFGLGVIMCICNSDYSKVLLLKRNAIKRAKNGLDWGNVGGRVELGEKLIDACIREAREEIGLNLNPEKLKLIEIKETPFMSDIFHALHFVYTTTLDESEKITLNDESEDYQWFSLDSLPDKTLDPKEDLIKWSKIAQNKFSENDR